MKPDEFAALYNEHLATQSTEPSTEQIQPLATSTKQVQPSESSIGFSSDFSSDFSDDFSEDGFSSDFDDDFSEDGFSSDFGDDFSDSFNYTEGDSAPGSNTDGDTSSTNPAGDAPVSTTDEVEQFTGFSAVVAKEEQPQQSVQPQQSAPDAVPTVEQDAVPSVEQDAVPTVEQDDSQFRIESVQVPIVEKGEQEDENILTEIANYLEFHRIKTSNNAEDLCRGWADLYGVAVKDTNTLISMYCMLHYSLVFDSKEALTLFAEQPKQFREKFKMHRRVCTMEDITDVKEVWQNDWFSFDVIDLYANTKNITSLLIDLMRDGKYDLSLLANYTEDTGLLIDCIRAMLSDSFDAEIFSKAAENGTVENYLNASLSDVTNPDSDRFALLRDREDFSEIYTMIVAIESSGKLISQEFIEKYHAAFYLKAILTAESQGRLNEDFASEYLMKDLGDYKFIADIYERNEIDLTLDPLDVLRAKLLTDVKHLGLDPRKFEPKYKTAIACLVCSRYIDALPELDYRKFLAVCSFNRGDSLLTTLNSSTSIIHSYNKFWFQYFLTEMELNFIGTISNNVKDCILYFKQFNGRTVQYYLSLDDFILNTAEFKNLVQDAKFAGLLNSDSGIVLSDTYMQNELQVSAKTLYDSSLTTWAKGVLHPNIVKQFEKYNVPVHANLLRVLELAVERFKKDNETAAEMDRTKMQVSGRAKNLLTQSLSEYCKIDSVLSFISEHRIFLGLMASSKCDELIYCLATVYQQDYTARIILMFLYSVFKKYYPDKLAVDGASFKTLDARTNMLFVKGLGLNIQFLSFKDLINSFDGILSVAGNCKQIQLGVKDGNICLYFVH